MEKYSRNIAEGTRDSVTPKDNVISGSNWRNVEF